MKTKPTKHTAAVPKDPREHPEYFTWQGKRCRAGDVFLFCFPAVGLLQEVRIVTFYCYGPEYCYTSIHFYTIDWCSIVLTMDNPTSWRKAGYRLELNMKWWQSDLYNHEDGCVHIGRRFNNPFHHKGYPEEFCSVPMQLDGYVLRPLDGWQAREPEP